jgi:hypothetical protein
MELVLIIGRRYRAMESAATRLQKEAKGYLDSLRGSCLRLSFPGKLAVVAITSNESRWQTYTGDVQ